jgi:hypothetical protein
MNARTMLVLFALVASGFGQWRWQYIYNGPHTLYDAAQSVVYGPDGKVYAAGQSSDTANNGITAIPVVRLAPSNGNQEWVERYNSMVPGYNRVKDMTYSDGNLYIAGNVSDTFGVFSFGVLSLTAAGTARWSYSMNGAAMDDDEAFSVVRGMDGNIYVCGYTRGTSTGDDFTVVSLSSDNGAERWKYVYNRNAGDPDDAYSLAWGPDGNLYAAGTTSGDTTGGDFSIVSLTPDDSVRWWYHYNGGGYVNDAANCIICGADSNLYAAGMSNGGASSNDFFVASVDLTGNQRWTYRYNGPANGLDAAGVVLRALDGNIYACGQSMGSGTSTDITVVALTPGGNERWVYRYDGPGNYADDVSKLRLGDDGNLYVVSSSIGNGTGRDIVVISLTPGGSERWVYRYNGPGNGDDWGYDIAYGADDKLYAAGLSFGSGTYQDFIVISLNKDVGIAEAPAAFGRKPAGPTVVAAVRLQTGNGVEFFSADGRRLSRPKPGVCFVCVPAAGTVGRVRRVIVPR